MKKLFKACVAVACVAAMMTGCSSSSKYSKVGLGVVSSLSDDGQVNTTFAAVGLDGDGKIQYIDVDVAQSTPTDDAKAQTQTKKQRKEGYGMKSTSAQIGKIEGGAEWYEQIAAFENYCTGKTAEEVANIETEENAEGNKSAKAGSDLAAGCTMAIGDFQEAIAKAVANAQEVSAEKIGLGRAIANDKEQAQVNTNLALVATDGDGKVVYSKIDVAQIYKGVLETKSERKEGYGMKDTSAKIGKIEGGAEWYQQAAAFENAINGKTLDEIKAIPTETGDHGTVAKAGSDLAAGCTIGLDAFLATVESAMSDLK